MVDRVRQAKYSYRILRRDEAVRGGTGLTTDRLPDLDTRKTHLRASPWQRHVDDYSQNENLIITDKFTYDINVRDIDTEYWR